MKSLLSRLATALGALLFIVPAAAAQTELPSGVTKEMVAEGETIFKGAGICFTCHGQDATGVPGLGANLTDSEWVHNDGSYQQIVATILSGVTSSTGAVMPPKGGPPLTDDQVKAVAAYVWSLSHKSSQ